MKYKLKPPKPIFQRTAWNRFSTEVLPLKPIIKWNNNSKLYIIAQTNHPCLKNTILEPNSEDEAIGKTQKKIPKNRWKK